MEEQQGLRCGEANPNQGLRQPYRGPTTPRGGRGKERTQTAQGSRREGLREVRDHMLIVSVNPEPRLAPEKHAQVWRRAGGTSVISRRLHT